MGEHTEVLDTYLICPRAHSICVSYLLLPNNLSQNLMAKNS
jgi:hypothetical protein